MWAGSRPRSVSEWLIESVMEPSDLSQQRSSYAEMLETWVGFPLMFLHLWLKYLFVLFCLFFSTQLQVWSWFALITLRFFWGGGVECKSSCDKLLHNHAIFTQMLRGGLFFFFFFGIYAIYARLLMLQNFVVSSEVFKVLRKRPAAAAA